MSDVSVIPVDPTLPTVTVPVVLDGKPSEVILCCDFGVLMDAEAELIAEGHDVNLMQCLQTPMTASGVRMFFAIASRRFQPKLDYATALKLFTLQNAPAVANAIPKVWAASMPPVVEGEGIALDPPAPSDASAESSTGSGSSPQPVVVSGSDSTNSAG